MAKRFFKVPDISAVIVLFIGLSLGLYKSGFPEITILTLPSLVLPDLKEFTDGLWRLSIPQIPLTITNSILSVSLLTMDLFNKKIDTDKLSKSVGVMNILTTPLGGFPMCHGAGGLAAHYRFGARTGGSNIINGVMLIVIALFFSGSGFINLIPMAVFGSLMIFVAVELARHAIKTDSFVVTGAMAILVLFFNMTVGFVVGMVLAHFVLWLRRKSSCI